MVLGDPHMKFVFCEIGNVMGQGFGVVMHRLARQDPAHMRPPRTIDRRMWVTFLVRVLVMDAMRGYPKNRPALKRESRTDGEKVFHPFRSFVATMREQAVIAHSDAEASGDPPQESRNQECLPRKEKKCSNCTYVKSGHKESCDPIHLFVG